MWVETKCCECGHLLHTRFRIENFTPLPGKVLLEEPAFPEDLKLREGGLIIVHQRAQRSVSWAHRRMMKVVAVGREVEHKVGAFVFVDEFAGGESLWLGDSEYWIVLEGEAQAVIYDPPSVGEFAV
jgi:hypothetical protein